LPWELLDADDLVPFAINEIRVDSETELPEGWSDKE